jgi:hypothetical protein
MPNTRVNNIEIKKKQLPKNCLPTNKVRILRLNFKLKTEKIYNNSISLLKLNIIGVWRKLKIRLYQ